jgi:hypothetical protein
MCVCLERRVENRTGYLGVSDVDVCVGYGSMGCVCCCIWRWDGGDGGYGCCDEDEGLEELHVYFVRLISLVQTE